MFFFYLMGTNAIVVISLNILISIVTDNYDNVLMRMNAIDQKHKAGILLENEVNLFWKRNLTYYGYLFILRYMEDQGGNGSDGQANGEW
jgi:hypothetical protein